MYNLEIIKKASNELNNIDSKKVVKVAGILQNIKNWFKSLVNPEFRKRVTQLQNDSVQVKTHLDGLEKNLKDIDVAISNGDIENYTQILEEVKRHSTALTKQLNELYNSADKAQPNVEESSTKLPSKIIPIGSVLGGDNLIMTNNFVNSIHIHRVLLQAIENTGISKEEAALALNKSSFFKELKDATAAGKVVDIKYRDDHSNKNLNGDYIYTVFTPEIFLSNLPLSIQAYIEVVDQTYNKYKPMPVKVMKLIKKVVPIRVGPTNRARIKEQSFLSKVIKTAEPWYLNKDKILKRIQEYNSSDYIPPKRTPVSRDEFMNSLSRIWDEIFPNIPKTEKGLATIYSKVAFETGGLKLMYNYNIGNIKALPNKGKWTGFNCSERIQDNTGKIKNIKFTKKHPICYFRAFDSLDEGIRFYLDFLNSAGKGRYKEALLAGAKGDVDTFANKLKEAGYYTDDPKTYASGMKYHLKKYYKSLGKDLPKEEEKENIDTINLPIEVKNTVNDLFKGLGLNMKIAKPLTDLVVNSISEKLLPKNKVYVNVKAANFSEKMEYAYVLSNALARTIDADSDICSNGSEVHVTCDTTGNLDTIYKAVEAIDNIVANSFKNKYKKIIISTVKLGSSKHPIFNEIKVERERRKFALKEILHN